LTFENLESTVIIVPSVTIVLYVSIIGLVIYSVRIIILWWIVSLLSFSTFKKVSQSWIFIKSDSFKLSIREEAIDHGCDIINETNYRVCVNKFIERGCRSSTILNWRKEVYHKRYSKEKWNKDEKHHPLIAALVLDHVQDEDEEKSKYSLLQKFSSSNEIEKDYNALSNRQYFETCFISATFFGWRNDFRT
jgi:hypothetical protein